MGLITLSFLVFYPSFTFSPIKHSQVLAQENTQQKHEILAGSLPSPFSLPHPGYLSSRYSSYHPAIDIATGLGMPIHPITTGVIEEAGFHFWGLGNFVVINHADGFKSTYGHMGKIYVKKGQEVTTSSTLGEVGLTGHTSGPHTHLEITHHGQYINPQSLLPEIEDFPKAEYLRPVGGNVQKEVKEVKTNLSKNLKPSF